jgi:hypothetical protein
MYIHINVTPLVRGRRVKGTGVNLRSFCSLRQLCCNGRDRIRFVTQWEVVKYVIIVHCIHTDTWLPQGIGGLTPHCTS